MWAKMQREKIQRFEAIDWIRSGLLAWRLCKPLEAQTLLEEAAKNANVVASTAAWKELIEMYAHTHKHTHNTQHTTQHTTHNTAQHSWISGGPYAAN